jgi:hypothetical protein
VLLLDTDSFDASDHICPPHFRPDDELFRKALAVCGPVMRTCINCWKAKSTRSAMEAIKEEIRQLSLEDAQYISNMYRFTDASFKISLVVPANGHRSMDLAKLSEYAERTLMNQIYKTSWKSVLQMLVRLDTIPDARSFEGRIFEDVAHVLFSDPETELEPLYGAPPRNLGVLGPLRYVSLSDAMKTRPGDKGNEKWLVVGYYPAAKNGATIDAMAIVKESDSTSDFRRAILLQYTKRRSKKPFGLLKVRANFKALGFDDLIPFEKSHSDDRLHWVFIWVIPRRAAANFQGKTLSHTDGSKWMDTHIDQYKLVVDMDKLDEKMPSMLCFHSTYPR